jgi:hypothetical protein
MNKKIVEFLIKAKKATYAGKGVMKAMLQDLILMIYCIVRAT